MKGVTSTWPSTPTPLLQGRFLISPNGSKLGSNRGHLSLTKTMGREVPGSTPHCSHAFMVSASFFGGSLIVLSVIEGCAMIVARSFARIHETNLKVKYP